MNAQHFLRIARRRLAKLIGGSEVLTLYESGRLLQAAQRQRTDQEMVFLERALRNQKLSMWKEIVPRLEYTLPTGNNKYLEVEDNIILNQKLPWNDRELLDWEIANRIGRSKSAVVSRRHRLHQQEKKQ
jgi:hypothetical protein